MVLFESCEYQDLLKDALRDELSSICEFMGWRFRESSGEYEIGIRSYTPAGEDFSFTVDRDDPLSGLLKYTDSFDPEAHVMAFVEAKLNGDCGIPSIFELCDGAKWLGGQLAQMTEMAEYRFRDRELGVIKQYGMDMLEKNGIEPDERAVLSVASALQKAWLDITEEDFLGAYEHTKTIMAQNKKSKGR